MNNFITIFIVILVLFYLSKSRKDIKENYSTKDSKSILYSTVPTYEPEWFRRQWAHYSPYRYRYGYYPYPLYAQFPYFFRPNPNNVIWP